MPLAPTAINKDNIGRAGRDLENTVSEQALDFDVLTVGAGAVLAHTADPVGAHTASAISLADLPDSFEADQVESAFAEVANTVMDSRWNGVVIGGGFTSVGTTITIDTPTRVLVNGNVKDFSGQDIVFPSDGIRILAVTPAGTLSALSSQAPLTTENVYLHEIFMSSGSVFSTIDQRMFVDNIDRKMPLSVQTGVSDSNPLEGSAHFLSFEAAFAWLELFNLGGLLESRNSLIIRGSNVVTSTLDIPLDGLVLVGDGRDAELVTGATLSPLLNIGAKNRIEIRNLTFKADDASSIAIKSVGGDEVVIENCRFVSGASDWTVGIQSLTTGNSTNLWRIIGNDITASSSGIEIRRPNKCRIIDTHCTHPTSGGSSGIILGTTISAGEGFNVLRGVHVTGYSEGISSQTRGTRITNCVFDNCPTGALVTGSSIDFEVSGTRFDTCGTGIDFGSSTTVTKVTGCTFVDVDVGINISGDTCLVSNSSIDLNASTGVFGVTITGENIKLTSCHLNNPRTSYSGSFVPIGIRCSSGATDVSIVACTIKGFLNDNTTDFGVGIDILSGASDIKVIGGRIEDSPLSVQFNSGASVLNVAGLCITDAQTGFTLSGDDVIIDGCRVETDSTTGIQAFAVTGDDVIISDTKSIMTRTSWSGETPFGIVCSGARMKVTGSYFLGFTNTTNSLGAGIYFKSGASDADILGTTFDTCWKGVVSDGITESFTMAGLNVIGCRFDSIADIGVEVNDAERIKISENQLNDPGDNYGITCSWVVDLEVNDNSIDGNLATTGTGIRLVGQDANGERIREFIINDNNIRGCEDNGILVQGQCHNGVISGNQVDGFIDNTSEGTLIGIQLLCTTSIGDDPEDIKYVNVSSNTVSRCGDGIVGLGVRDDPFDALIPKAFIQQCVFDGNIIHHCAKNLVSSNAAKGLFLRFGVNCTISDNNIHKIGFLISDQDSEFQLAAWTDVSSEGIKLESCTACSITGNDITQLARKGSGASISIYFQQSDNSASAVDFATSLVVIDGNRCVGVTTSTNFEITSHIFFQLAKGAGNNVNFATDCIISNNVCDTSEFTAIALTIGEDSRVNRFLIEGNTVRQVEGTGGHGIGVFTDSTNGATWEDITIHNNSVTDIQDSTTGDSSVGGIFVDYGNDTVSPNPEGLHITSNRIRDCAGHGIRLISNLDDTGSGPDFLKLTVSGNTVTDPGIHGISLFSSRQVSGDKAGTLIDSAFNDNQVTGASGGEAMKWQLDSFIDQVTVSGNRFDNTGSGSSCFSILVDSSASDASEAMREVTLVGNTFVGGVGISIFVTGPGNIGTHIQNLSIIGCTIRDSSVGGILIQVDEKNVAGVPEIENITISGCTFRDLDDYGIRIDNGDASAVAIVNINIVDNNFKLCATDGSGRFTIYVRAQSEVNNLSICNNNFVECGGTRAKDTSLSNIMLQVGDDGDLVSNVSVNGNSFYNNAGKAIVVEEFGNENPILQNLMVNNNSIRLQENTGILLNLTNFTEARNLSVCDNNINDIDGAFTNLATPIVGFERHGIHVRTANFPTNDPSPTYNLSINGNLIHATGSANPSAASGDESDGRGIYLDVLDDLIGLSICNNQVTDTQSNGIRIGANSASGDLFQNANISNNIVSFPGGTRRLAYNLIFGMALQNFVFCGNITTGSTFGVRVVTGTSGTGVRLVFTDNVVSDSSSDVTVTGNQWTTTNYDGLISSHNISESAGSDDWTNLGGTFGGSTKHTTSNIEGV